MNLLPSNEGFMQRIVSVLFPVKLPERIKGLALSAEYHERLSRTGVDHKPGFAFGRVVEPAREKRVFLMPGRSF
jgi:hypothetical protein